MVWRRFRVPGATSLATLHHCIQIVNNWDDFYLHQFHIYGKDYGTSNSGGFSSAYGADKTCLDDFGFDVSDKFKYEYNFFEYYLLDIRIEDIKDLTITKGALTCLSGSGMLGATKYDAMDIELKMLKTIVDKKGKLLWEDIQDFKEKMNSVKFNKKHVNTKIQPLTNV